MTEQPLPHPQLLLAIAALEARARAADSLNSLAFVIANDTHSLLHFRQALVFACEGTADWKLLAVSGLALPTEDSPYLVWLKRAAAWLATVPMTENSAWIGADSATLPDDVAAGWQEWWPAGIWCVRLVDQDKMARGRIVYLLDAPPDTVISDQIVRLSETWSYCWSALDRKKKPWTWRATPRMRRIAVVAALIVCLLPVRQTALAPAEVVGSDAVIVAAPLEGVVKALHVRPNQAVKKGERLFSLDDTTLKNRLEVTRKAVAVADAELTATSQRSFDSTQSQSRNDIALLTGRSEERRAELAAIQAQLARIEVLAPRDGVAMFGDPNDWLGKPVTTGERIMLLADPAQPAMLLNLPVADAIALEIGAPVKLYLSARPLSSIEGRLTETSYQAITTPDGVAAYRLRASIDGSTQDVRLGLHGTAKIYGDWVVLIYYVLRRPLAALRAWSGL